jgi:hypothetical protein
MRGGAALARNNAASDGPRKNGTFTNLNRPCSRELGWAVSGCVRGSFVRLQEQGLRPAATLCLHAG